LMSSRPQTKMRSNRSRPRKASGIINPDFERKAATGPTPGTVIRRRQTGSCCSTRCNRS
jgi:hypothetical protein